MEIETQKVWVAYDQVTGDEVDRDEVLAELWKRKDKGVHYIQEQV